MLRQGKAYQQKCSILLSESDALKSQRESLHKEVDFLTECIQKMQASAVAIMSSGSHRASTAMIGDEILLVKSERP